MKTSILLNGDMVVTYTKEERELQLHHLNSLIPANQVEYDEITVLMNLVERKPTLKLIQGGTS